MKPAPLDSQEAWVLTANLLISQLILLAIGIAGSIALAGLASGDWMDATFGFDWADTIWHSLDALSLAPTLTVGCALAASFTAIAYLSERRALSTDRGRQSVLRTRQGINGELARLPLPLIVVLMALTGFSEELLFRFALVGIVEELLSPILPGFAGATVALLASSVAFWLSHVRYRDLVTTVLTLALAFVLGGAFLVSGSLAVVAAAHTLYDISVLVIARIQMTNDPGYFGGPAPTRAMLDQLEREEAKTGSNPDE